MMESEVTGNCHASFGERDGETHRLKDLEVRSVPTLLSPLLANLYLHHAFDEWMQQIHPTIHFERYADDIVIHCQTEQQAVGIWQELASRMAQYKLELHPDKT